jgi:hypothetical protein
MNEAASVFGVVRSTDVRSIAGPALDIEVAEGTELLREGQLAGKFFVIRTGHAELWSGTSMVSTLGPGRCFGEINACATQPQRFTVRASSPMRLTAFSAFGIELLCATFPGTRERILELLPAASGNGRAAASLPERGGIENGDRPVVGGDPPELAHQPQCARDRLAGRARPSRKLILGQR